MLATMLTSRLYQHAHISLILNQNLIASYQKCFWQLFSPIRSSPMLYPIIAHMKAHPLKISLHLLSVCIKTLYQVINYAYLLPFMILFQNDTITLVYTPATQVLTFNYPNLHSHSVSKVKHNLDTLVETVRKHRIKGVLLDASESHVTVHEDVFMLVTNYMLIGLKSAEVLRVGRLPFRDRDTELLAKKYFDHIGFLLSSSLQIRKHFSRSDAHAWLGGVLAGTMKPENKLPEKEANFIII